MADYKRNNRIRLGLEPPPLQQMSLQGLMRGRNLNQAEIDRLGVLGINALSLFKGPLMTQVDRVLFNGEYFEFADEGDDRGEKVLTMGVRSDAGLIDAILLLLPSSLLLSSSSSSSPPARAPPPRLRAPGHVAGAGVRPKRIPHQVSYG